MVSIPLIRLNGVNTRNGHMFYTHCRHYHLNAAIFYLDSGISARMHKTYLLRYTELICSDTQNLSARIHRTYLLGCIKLSVTAAALTHIKPKRGLAWTEIEKLANQSSWHHTLLSKMLSACPRLKNSSKFSDIWKLTKDRTW